MKKVLLLLILCSSLTIAYAQDDAPSQVRSLVQEGVELHDQGKYDLAIAKYQEALKLAPTNETAQSEMAMTYNAMGRHKEAIAICKRLLKEHSDTDPATYITYGNSLDALKKTKDAAEIYKTGLARYPDSYSLYFNQGVMLTGQAKLAEATASMQQAVILNPSYASGNMSLGALSLMTKAQVPAIFALSRFLVLEPRSQRSGQRRTWLDEAVMGKPREAGKPVAISISASDLDIDGKNSKPDGFGMVELMLSSAGGLYQTDQFKDKTATEKFIVQFGILAETLKKQLENPRSGFNWEFYAPYFVEMASKNHTAAFAYLVHSSQTDTPDVAQWLAAHPTEVQAFQEWSKNYAWPKAKL